MIFVLYNGELFLQKLLKWEQSGKAESPGVGQPERNYLGPLCFLRNSLGLRAQRAGVPTHLAKCDLV